MYRSIRTLSRSRAWIELWNSMRASPACNSVLQASMGQDFQGGGSRLPFEWRSARLVHTQNSEHDGVQSTSPEDEGRSHADFETQLLEQALSHVKSRGWSHEALQQAAVDLGLSKAAGATIPDGPAKLVLLFMSNSNKTALEDLEKEAKESQEQEQEQDQRQWLSRCLRVRLELTGRLIEHMPGAARVMARPDHAWKVAQLVHEFIDGVWYLSGDRSMDVSWYPKRAALSGIFSAAQLHMITDFSPGFEDTWRFIDDKIKGMLETQKFASRVPSKIGRFVQDAKNLTAKQLSFMKPF